MSNDTIDALDVMRHDLGFPFIISSGYRCPTHNNKVSSSGLSGPHTTGLAADIFISGENALKVVSAALEYGFGGVGINQKGSYKGRFIHLDRLEPTAERPRPHIFSY